MECRSDSLHIVMRGSSILGRYLISDQDYGFVHLWSQLDCEFILFTWALPFFFTPLICLTETEQGVALAILRGVLDFKREPWPQISESAKSLVRQMLDPDPRKRLTAQQVLGKFL